jgi:hypothetical protein
MHQSTLPTSFQAETGLPKILLTLLMSLFLPTSAVLYCSLQGSVRYNDVPDTLYFTILYCTQHGTVLYSTVNVAVPVSCPAQPSPFPAQTAKKTN